MRVGSTTMLFSRSFPVFLAAWFCLGAMVSWPTTAKADESADAEAAAQALARDQERLGGFSFRAEVWTGSLPSEVGKAVKMQLFKGHEYCIGVAVPRKSGIRVTGAVLDFQGQPVGEIQPVLDGWGFLLFFKPKKTGVYVVVIRQEEEGRKKDTTCALVTGYK